MKRIQHSLYIITTVSMILLFSSCNNFLDREPLDGFTDDNYWTSEAQVKTYAWKFYDMFMGYGNGTGTTAEFYFQSASTASTILISDDLVCNNFLQYQANPGSANSDWDDNYEYIRRANLMLERLPDVPMETEAYNHWEGVACFFRALAYFKLVQRFGDVPYYDYVLYDDDLSNGSKIYLSRTNRNQIMEYVKQDIDKALNQVRSSGESNAVNTYVVLALKSRICLYEGTYRKYHSLGDYTSWLEEARAAALGIMASSQFSIRTGTGAYKEVYNSEDLNFSSEMILYKIYTLGILANSIQAYTNTSTVGYGMTKAAIESYVCADGLPIEQSPLYQGDKSLDDVLANRDERLLATVDSEGISFRGFETSLSRSRKSSTGYVIYLYYNESSNNITTTGQNTIDAPVFALSEVLLNYAEASAELGLLTQEDLDITVNVLRSRAGIPPLTYISDNEVRVNGVTINDPKRTAALEEISGVVPSIIWEIRRERRAELMTWTVLRYYDLMRWKKGDYLDYTANPDVAIGAYVDASTLGEKDEVVLTDDGYIMAYPTNTRTFNPDKHYLNAIPTGQIDLYRNEGLTLEQNPGW